MIIRSWFGTVCAKNADCRTIKVEVSRAFPHPKYGKVVKAKKKFLVDIDPESCAKLVLGDKVRIQECKKVSKLKSKRFVGLGVVI